MLEAAFDFVFPSTWVKFEDSDGFGAWRERLVLKTHGLRLWRTIYCCDDYIFWNRGLTQFSVTTFDLTLLDVEGEQRRLKLGPDVHSFLTRDFSCLMSAFFWIFFSDIKFLLFTSRCSQP